MCAREQARHHSGRQGSVAGVPRTTLLRLCALGAFCLFLVVGLGIEMWPSVAHEKRWALMQEFGGCMLMPAPLSVLVAPDHRNLIQIL